MSWHSLRKSRCVWLTTKYTYIYIYIYHTYIYIFIHIHIHIYLIIYIYKYIHMYMYIYIYILLWVEDHVRLQPQVYLKQKLNCVLMSAEEMVKPKEEATVF